MGQSPHGGRLRLATLGDIAALNAVIAESARGLSVGYYTDEQIELAIKCVYGVDSQLIKDQTYFVVEIDGAMAGCGGWSKRRTLYGGDQMKGAAPDPLLDPATEAAKIRAFFVHPDFARRGVGSMLMRACEDAARAAEFTSMEMGSTLPGVPLYEAFGYRAIDRVDMTMERGVVLQVIRMRKPLV